MKRLVRSRLDRKLAGVIGGFAEYFGVDATMLRVAFVALLIFTGFFPMGLLYIICTFLIPNEEDVR